MSLVRVEHARRSSPDLSTSCDSAPLSRAPSSLCFHRFHQPRLIHHIASYVPVQTASRTVPPSSRSSELTGALPQATARPATTAASCPPYDLRLRSHLTADENSQYRSTRPYHTSFRKETLGFLCFASRSTIV